ncbi:Store-operated calcium entry-associated regulatory factor [Neolecta irregularis DAH-3]|uniref:Store-operated calcium entry-associated regulatory factor n=1 Tax=Neolecta irregularis (strain DAH-3) TaxID=1198029 RepID=A0A1U7LWQ9_NEOID|nr:Store-operated calcium entry-associated regulatory factor [Neolecta irregularis DAH-3]|eukprot:OLL27107.1 Store-operated calcium entry-associated regulatory factor [Neolecta irregularis DAH-3]
MLTFLYLFLLLSPSIAILSQKVLLSQIPVLTLYTDKQTAHRRVPAIPQLSCTGGNACSLIDLLPQTMQCRNMGGAYGKEDIQWSCSTELSPYIKLGKTEMICEGYADPDDTYVLRGSCACEYWLWLTDEGEERFGRLPVMGKRSWFSWNWGRLFSNLSTLLIIGTALTILYQLIFGRPRQGGQPRRRGFGWGGDNNNDGPPPYFPRGGKPTDSQTGWQPGFWSGLAGGAAASYLGRRLFDGGNREYINNSPSMFGSPSGYSGMRAPMRNNPFGEGPSGTRTSTGFGGTRRR